MCWPRTHQSIQGVFDGCGSIEARIPCRRHAVAASFSPKLAIHIVLRGVLDITAGAVLLQCAARQLTRVVEEHRVPQLTWCVCVMRLLRACDSGLQNSAPRMRCLMKQHLEHARPSTVGSVDVIVICVGCDDV